MVEWEIASIYIVLTAVFSSGVAYATIKVSLSSVSREIEMVKKELDNARGDIQALNTEKEVNKYRFEEISRQIINMSEDIRIIASGFKSIEKRGSTKRWEPES